MKKSVGASLFVITITAFIWACTTDDSGDVSGDSSCAYIADTAETTTVNANGCALLDRDVSSCRQERENAGLSGYWLKFSCNVTLTVNGNNVEIATDGFPDHLSPYYGSSDPCYEEFNISGRNLNPGSIGALGATISVPLNPTVASSATTMGLGVVGVAVNGVAIFSNAAAGTDNIYDEALTFDSCEGHPAGTTYHYHIEPPAISQGDSNFIGVMYDGFPIYGQNESGGTAATGLDSSGGHVGPLPDDTSTTLYHYHVTNQSGTDGSGNPASALFITSGSYAGTPGSCSGCGP